MQLTNKQFEGFGLSTTVLAHVLRLFLWINMCPRYSWTHGITPRKQDVIPVQSPSDMESDVDSSSHLDAASDARSALDATASAPGLTLSYRQTRTSFTFRKILHTPCRCSAYSLLENDSVTIIITEKLLHFNLLQIKHTEYYSIGW